MSDTQWYFLQPDLLWLKRAIQKKIIATEANVKGYEVHLLVGIGVTKEK